VGENGFAHVVSGASLKSLGDYLVLPVCGKKYHRNIRDGFHLLHQLDAVTIGQHQVQYHQIRSRSPGYVKRLNRVAGNHYQVARP